MTDATSPRRHRPKPRTPRVVTYPRDAVLTIEQVARGLSVPVSRVEKMDLPTIWCGKGRLPRFLWGQILDTLAERAAKGVHKPQPLRVSA